MISFKCWNVFRIYNNRDNILHRYSGLQTCHFNNIYLDDGNVARNTYDVPHVRRCIVYGVECIFSSSFDTRILHTKQNYSDGNVTDFVVVVSYDR